MRDARSARAGNRVHLIHDVSPLDIADPELRRSYLRASWPRAPTHLHEFGSSPGALKHLKQAFRFESRQEAGIWPWDLRIVMTLDPDRGRQGTLHQLSRRAADAPDDGAAAPPLAIPERALVRESGRARLLAALTDAERWAGEFEGRVIRDAGERFERERILVETLRAERALRAGLEAETQMARASLIKTNERMGDLLSNMKGLAERMETLASERADFATALNERGAEAEGLRKMVKHQESEAQRSAMQQREDGLVIDRLQQTTGELKVRIAEGSNYVGNLLSQIGEKDAQINEGSAYARRLECEIAERCRAYDALRPSLQDFLSTISGCVDTLLEVTGEQPPLRQPLPTSADAAELVTCLRLESSYLARLTGAVGASRFFRLKRWLRRKLG